jgi:hypothetical protein
VQLLELVQQQLVLEQQERLQEPSFRRKRSMQQRPTMMPIRGSFSFQFLDGLIKV